MYLVWDVFVQSGSWGWKMYLQVLVDGPSTKEKAGVPRHSSSLANLIVTPIVIAKLPRAAGRAPVAKAWKDQNVDEKWDESAWAKRRDRREKRRALTDFERFKVLRLKKQVRHILKFGLESIGTYFQTLQIITLLLRYLAGYPTSQWSFMGLCSDIRCHILRAGAICCVFMATFETYKLQLTWLLCRQGSRFARRMQRFELRQSHLRSIFFRYTVNQWVLSKNSSALCSRRQLLSAIQLKSLSFVFSTRNCAYDAIAWTKIMKFWSNGIKSRTLYNFQSQVWPGGT